MPKKAKPGDSDRGTNLTETKEIVRNAVPEIVNLIKQRKAINEDIAAIRERVNAAGINKKALDHAIKLREMDPEDRQNFDEGVAIVRDVIGVAISRSLFDMLDTPTGQDQDGGEDEEQEQSDQGPKPAGKALANAKKHLGGAPVPDAVH